LQPRVEIHIMRLGQFIPALFCAPCRKNPKRDNTEKDIAIPLARCARVPRATVRLSALSSCQGGSPTPVEIPPSVACRPKPLRGTLAGASCAVASCRTYLAVTGASFAALAGVSGLTAGAGQAAHTVGGVRGAVWTPAALPHWTVAA
jgi:hypothetical protein